MIGRALGRNDKLQEAELVWSSGSGAQGFRCRIQGLGVKVFGVRGPSFFERSLLHAAWLIVGMICKFHRIKA